MRLSPLFSCIMLVGTLSAFNTCENCQVNLLVTILLGSNGIIDRKKVTIWFFRQLWFPSAIIWQLLPVLSYRKSHWNGIFADICPSNRFQHLSSFLMSSANLTCQVSNCYFGVRNYWGPLAKQFWHGYYDPEVCFPSILYRFQRQDWIMFICRPVGPVATVAWLLWIKF